MTGPTLSQDAAEGIRFRKPRFTVLFARVLIGLIVLICAEVFSGASLRVGL